MVQSPNSFFASLYDLSFRSFITPKIIQIVYVIALVCIGLLTIGFLISGFAPQPSLFGPTTGPSIGGILFHIIAAPIMFLVGSVIARIELEFVIAVFRIAENTEGLRKP